ncbi:MAG: ABC transporter ATP-binding protein [Planctomycetes bacterium]|nr:ABC transporter ATP-binding protein [Planctomycetota bacterium]
MLELKDVTKTYSQGGKSVEALRGVSLTLDRGEFVTIVGPSGSGKSTLLHLAAGLDTPTSGKVIIDGVSTGEMNDDELSLLRRRRIGLVFQFFNLLPSLTALENVMLPMLLESGPTKEVKARAQELLALVGLEDRTSHRPEELSGGQAQRVAIARSLIMKPPLVLADEPTGNLDSSTGAEILKTIRELGKNEGFTFIMVTHDLEASRLGSRRLTIRDGLIVDDERWHLPS